MSQHHTPKHRSFLPKLEPASTSSLTELLKNVTTQNASSLEKALRFDMIFGMLSLFVLFSFSYGGVIYSVLGENWPSKAKLEEARAALEKTRKETRDYLEEVRKMERGVMRMIPLYAKETKMTLKIL